MIPSFYILVLTHFTGKYLYNRFIFLYNPIMKPMNTITAKEKGYHETKRHTDALFPYNVYLCTIPSDFPSVFLHWQDTMEIIYVKKGTGVAQMDLESFDIAGGDILFAPPGRLHGLNGKPGQKMEYENIIFDLSFLGSTLVDLCSQKYLLPLKNGRLRFPSLISSGHPAHQSLAACLDDADLLCDRRPPGYELGVKAAMMKLFSLIFQLGLTDLQPDYPQKNLDRLKMVLNYLEAHYRESLPVSRMALACGYSESHFMRWFREMTGTSFVKYLIRYRLEKACEQLKDTQKTVLEISVQCGFDNLSNFNRLFKKQFGMTPGQMRKKAAPRALC